MWPATAIDRRLSEDEPGEHKSEICKLDIAGFNFADEN